MIGFAFFLASLNTVLFVIDVINILAFDQRTFAAEGSLRMYVALICWVLYDLYRRIEGQ